MRSPSTAPLAQRPLSLWGVAPPNQKPCACGHPKAAHKGVKRLGACADTRCSGCDGFSEVSR